MFASDQEKVLQLSNDAASNRCNRCRFLLLKSVIWSRISRRRKNNQLDNSKLGSTHQWIQSKWILVNLVILDAVWMQSGCGLDVVWMWSGCGLDAKINWKVACEKLNCGCVPWCRYSEALCSVPCRRHIFPVMCHWWQLERQISRKIGLKIPPFISIFRIIPTLIYCVSWRIVCLGAKNNDSMSRDVGALWHVFLALFVLHKCNKQRHV